MNVVTDVCMCEYTSHGHCGILTEGGYVDNDKTLEHLAQIAVETCKSRCRHGCTFRYDGWKGVL